MCVKGECVFIMEYFDYQQEVPMGLKLHKNLILNWSRGLGKTFTLAKLVLDKRPKNVLYIRNNNNNSLIGITENIKQILMEKNNDYLKNINGIQYGRKCVNIKWGKEKEICNYSNYNDNQTNIYNYYDCENLQEQFQNIRYDYVFFDNILPYLISDLKYNRSISTITMNNFDKKLNTLYSQNYLILEADYKEGIKNNLYRGLELTDMNKENQSRWYSEFAILDDPCKKISDNSLIDILSKLEKELNYMPYNKDTVLTRKNLLEMILSIYKQLEFKPKSIENNIQIFV